MAENHSKTEQNYGLPKVELIPIDRTQPGVAKAAKKPLAAEPESKDRRWIPIVLLVFFGLALAALLYYFFWGNDNSTPQTVDNETTTTQDDRVTLDENEGSGAEESGETAIPTEDATADETATTDIATEEPGSIVTISQRTERYYIFLGSYKFQAYARRHAERLAADGFAVKLITPDNWVGMRVAVGNYASINEASADANMIKSKYGNEVVVSKY